MDFKNAQIGFIGIGVMGRSMARHLLLAGYNLHIHTRTKDSALLLIEEGAVWEATPARLASKCRLIITMVGFPDEVEMLYLGDEGLIRHADRGTYLVDMSTSDPRLAERIAATAKMREIEALDAPVSGGDVGAKNATLSIMVGGSRAAFEKLRPFFHIMGKNVVYQGDAGAGQHAKLANQIAIASGMVAVCEALAYAKSAGLNLEAVLASIEKGAAGSWGLSNLAPRIIKGDFAPGFYVKHFVKDLRIALDSARLLGLKVPGLELAKSLYDELTVRGLDQEGTQALYKLYCD